MKTLSKTLLASAMVAAGITSFNTAHAVEWSLSGELAVELTDAESSGDLGLAVTTTDFVITVSETFGEVEVEGYQAFEKGDALARDGAGISVSGAFGSVFVGDDGVGVLAADLTDVMYNNSEVYFSDPSTNVIDYGLPLGDDFSLNLFVDITNTADDDPSTPANEETEEEDIDAIGIYGSYGIAGVTLAFGYTDLTSDGAYGGADGDDILDLAVAYEGGPFAAGVGFQDQDSATDEIISAFVSFSTGPVVITGYGEDAGDAGDLVALNVSYSFSDNFYAFFETAAYDDDTSDNTEVGLVLTF